MSKILFILASCLLVVCDFAWGQGSTYSGSYTRSPRVQYTNISDFIINGLNIDNTSNHCITLINCHNVTIKNCKLGPSPAFLGVYLSGCSNVTVTNCTFENLATAMIASVCTNDIKFEHNDVKNIQGPSNGGDWAWGQMVQFIQVKGPGHSISYNVCENISGQSAPEDIVNLNDGTSGTPTSPIKVSSNWIRGGGPSDSGGGICLGDGGGSYTLVENNILVNPGQYGIGVSGGHNHIIRKNKVYGRQQTFTNVGLSAWNQYIYISATYEIEIANNQVNYTQRDGSLNNWWFSDNVGMVAGKATNLYSPFLTPNVLPSQIIGRAMIPAPIWTSGWPVATEIVHFGFTACVNMNEAGASYYVILPTGSVSPNSNQVKAGKDACGNPIADNLKGFVSCKSGAIEYKVPITGLNENKSYDVYFVAENKELILQPTPMRVIVSVRKID